MGHPLLVNSKQEGSHELLGKAISQFVQATNEGNDLLWEWITSDFKTPTSSGVEPGRELHCLPHEFCSDSFLKDRVATSEHLLDIILASILRWSKEVASRYTQYHSFYNAFLHDTSWERNHTRTNGAYPPASLRLLFDAVEGAVKGHTARNSSWWQQHGWELQRSNELALRYLHVSTCLENISHNLESIAAVMTDSELFEYGELNYELGILMNAACPYLPDSVVEANQRMVMDTAGVVENRPGTRNYYRTRRVCIWLDWIPASCRLAEAQELLNRFAQPFFPLDRRPDVYLSGGYVRAPFTSDVFLTLSDNFVIELTKHYAGQEGRGQYEVDLTGGTDEVVRELQNAACSDPSRFIVLVPRLHAEVNDGHFYESVVRGIGYHVRFRTGRMSAPQQWIPLSKPDLTELARLLLRAVENLPQEFRGTSDGAESLLACAEVVTDPTDAEKLVVLLQDCLTSPDTQDRAQALDLLTTAVNSVRGRAAEAALTLYNRLLEASQPVPEHLESVLRRCATDSGAAVRAMVIHLLPYTLLKAPELGWALFDDAMSISDPRLWASIEQCLYHQYHNRFERVYPWLERIENEGPDESLGPGAAS